VSERIESIRKAVEAMHGVAAWHVESTPIRETFRGQVVWEGVVETFGLRDHPKAKRCHAWSYLDDKGETQFVGVLETPPVFSPLTAVKAAIVAGGKR
jgi:hypothetical protein